jgi:hypothetical protein
MMCRTTRTALTLATTILLGCDAATSAGPTAPVARPNALLGSAESGPGAFVTTGGTDVVLVQQVTLRYSFWARSTQDGMQTGEFTIQEQFPQGQPHVYTGVVTCFRINGEVATVGGRIQRDNGREIVFPLFNEWTVRDNGEGSVNPDEASVLGFFQGSPPTCLVTQSTSPVATGNVQVHAALTSP